MTFSQTFELLTPCFCAGFSKFQPEMRMASIRGQLRWWTRLLGEEADEYRFFGGVKGKNLDFKDDPVASSWKWSLTSAPNNPKPIDKPLVPHKSNNRGFNAPAIPPGSRYTIGWQSQSHPSFTRSPGATDRDALERILKVWMLFGTVGRRSTRGMGSVWPIQYQPTQDEFSQQISQLTLPSRLRWMVLPRIDSSDSLVRIAGETVHGLRRNQFHGNPLGFVAGNQRKCSPLRFKVGNFEDGLRLIAIWDNRPDRGGDLASAISAFSPHLRRLLQSFPTS